MRALISWSGGKDSAWALRCARELGVEPALLLTSYDEASGLIPIHEVPMSWIERHSSVLGIPLRKVPLPWPCGNDEYLQRMGDAWKEAAVSGIDCIVFGDIHLADIRAFRESALAGTGLTPLFPLWGVDSQDLANDIVRSGMNVTVTAVDERRLSREWVGRRFDTAFLEAMPPTVDPCGENGEFHTAVWL